MPDPQGRRKKVAIVFGGHSPEHYESIRAARTLYRFAVFQHLDSKYDFLFFYLNQSNQWCNLKISRKLAKSKKIPLSNLLIKGHQLHPEELCHVNVIYNTMMGTSGENGNIMGLADLLRIPMIGCDTHASIIALDKYTSKILVESVGIPIVPYLYADRRDNSHSLLNQVEKEIKFPCFVKPTNLGTCYFIFKANNRHEFLTKWKATTEANSLSQKYLIEKFIPNVEIRIFIFEDQSGKLHVNDLYVTTLKEANLDNGGTMFDNIDNSLPPNMRSKLREYAIKIFRLFQMKDYGRIDFFVNRVTDDGTEFRLGETQIYFNEANTQPFISKHNIEFMKKQNGFDYPKFLDMLIQKNLKRKSEMDEMFVFSESDK